MNKLKVKDLPIQFRRASPGVYLSVAALSCGAKDGEYRIHRTEHRGNGVSHSGRVRWHVRHVPTGQAIGHAHDGRNPYLLSLEDAIHTLNVVIGRRLRDAFEVLAKMNLEAERKLEDQRAAHDARHDLEMKIRGAIDAFLKPCSGSYIMGDHAALVRLIADAVES